MERASALRERRTMIRVDCFLPARYHSPHDESHAAEGRVTGLCVQGLGMLATTPVKPGDGLMVRFFLPGEDHLISLPGVVRWSRRAAQDRETHCGLEYTTVDDTTRFCLEAFIQGQLHPPRHLHGVTRALHQLTHDLSPEFLQIAGRFAVGAALLSVGVWALVAWLR